MSALVKRVPVRSVIVNAPAPLLDWTDLSAFDQFAPWLTNNGGTIITMTLTGSHDGVTADVNFAWPIDVGPGEQGSIPLPAPPQSRLAHRYWRVDAHSASPGYADAPADWGLDGTLRAP